MILALVYTFSIHSTSKLSKAAALPIDRPIAAPVIPSTLAAHPVFSNRSDQNGCCASLDESVSFTMAAFLFDPFAKHNNSIAVGSAKIIGNAPNISGFGKLLTIDIGCLRDQTDFPDNFENCFI